MVTTIIAIPPVSIAGVRKVRDFRIELSHAQPVVFAVIYFPERINVDQSQLNLFNADVVTGMDNSE
jgi:hypothetical protein